MNVEEDSIKNQIAQLKIMIAGLEDRLKEIQADRELEQKQKPHNPFDVNPWGIPSLPGYPYPPTHEWPKPRCSKCGLEMQDVMMYSCGQTDCPTQTRVIM